MCVPLWGCVQRWCIFYFGWSIFGMISIWDCVFRTWDWVFCILNCVFTIWDHVFVIWDGVYLENFHMYFSDAETCISLCLKTVLIWIYIVFVKYCTLHFSDVDTGVFLNLEIHHLKPYWSLKQKYQKNNSCRENHNARTFLSQYSQHMHLCLENHNGFFVAKITTYMQPGREKKNKDFIKGGGGHYFMIFSLSQNSYF